MRFLVDMPLSPKLAEYLRQQGHDAVHASDIGLSFSPDTVILENAKAQGRVIITADLDYPRLLAQAGDCGPGLILFRGGNYSEQQAKELLIWALKVIPENELPNSLVVIDKKRIRRIFLPIGPKL